MMLTADRRVGRGTHVLAEPPAALDHPDDHRDHRAAAHRLVDRRLDVRLARAARSPERTSLAQPVVGAAACAAAARTSRPASWRSSRGRRAPATSARRAAHGRSAARPPRRARRAAARARRRARRGPRPPRRSRITAYIWRSTIASTAREHAACGSRWPALRSSTSRYSGVVEAASSRRSVSRIRSLGRCRCRGPPIPNTPRMITSSVTACIRGASANASPTGQRSISWSATVGDHLHVALDRLAVERRQQQLALAHVARRRPRSAPSWGRGSGAAATRRSATARRRGRP